ncbi:MAG TPA: hypothetical protein VHV51_16890 [Polyangiaceae bacterium]|jgi:hypothetical protein|nr:hypothetical protein [Polyangiaceae bacterium]
MRRLWSVIFFAAGALVAQSCSGSSDHGSNGAASSGAGGKQADGGPDSSGGSAGGASRAGSGGTAVAGEAGTSAEGGASGAVGSGAPLSLAWQLSYGQSYAAHVAVDSAGAAIVSDSMFDSADVALGKLTVKSHGGADMMLSRVLADGTPDWARAYGGTSDDYPVSFVLDGAGDIFMSGLYNGTGTLGGASFPPFMGSAGRFDSSVAEFDANGGLIWATTINSNQEDFAGPGLAVSSAGDLFVPGSFLGTTSIGGLGHTAVGSWDGFIARYNHPNGSLQGALTFGGSAEDRASFALLTSTDLIVIGKFSGSVSFPTTPPTVLTSAGGSDVFIARLSLAGVMSGVVSFGGTSDEEIEGAALDSQGNLVLAGDFSSPILSILGGETLHGAGGMDFFLARLSPTLDHQWSVSFGSDADDAVRDLSLFPNGALAITGEFRDHLALGDKVWDATAGSDAGPTDIDYFVATLDSSGHPLWSYAAGGPGQERGLGVAADASGALYVTATFTSEIDFGSGQPLSAPAGQFASALVRYAP